jgi:hypothetical protein
MLTSFLYDLPRLQDRNVENHYHGYMELRLCLHLQNVGKSDKSIIVTTRKKTQL